LLRKYSLLIFILITAISGFTADNSLRETLVFEMQEPIGTGKELYDYITLKLGPGSIEAPDLYPGNHRGVFHITNQKDRRLGPAFAFHIHLKEDRDRDKFRKFNDRQRNEIKVYERSDKKLHGYEGSVFRYEWYFKVSHSMKVSKKFTHLFQIKPAKSDNDKFPLLTVTGSSMGSRDFLSVRYYKKDRHEILSRVPWDTIRGRWMKVSVRVRYSNAGFLSVSINDLQGNSLVRFDKNKISMWRGNRSGRAMVRPKWGIYRSTMDSSKLNKSDTVLFKGFRIYRCK